MATVECDWSAVMPRIAIADQVAGLESLASAELESLYSHVALGGIGALLAAEARTTTRTLLRSRFGD
ncbi:hypothetical protein ACKVMT_05775 [Halobacteriales archaeon Cl-PHB]